MRNKKSQGVGDEYKSRWYVGNYRHAMPYPRNNLYLAVRENMNITQKRAGALLGISNKAWRYRERSKRMYHLAEILCLHQMSGLSTTDFFKLLNDCA
jgi:hypothetical protein